MNEKKERKMSDTHRNLLNKNFEEIDQYLINTEHSAEYLEELINKLNAKYKTVEHLDNNIISLVNAKNVMNMIRK